MQAMAAPRASGVTLRPHPNHQLHRSSRLDGRPKTSNLSKTCFHHLRLPECRESRPFRPRAVWEAQEEERGLLICRPATMSMSCLRVCESRFGVVHRQGRPRHPLLRPLPMLAHLHHLDGRQLLLQDRHNSRLRLVVVRVKDVETQTPCKSSARRSGGSPGVGWRLSRSLSLWRRSKTSLRRMAGIAAFRSTHDTSSNLLEARNHLLLHLLSLCGLSFTILDPAFR